MWRILYTIGIFSLKLIYLLAAPLSPKAHAFNVGRKNLLAKLEVALRGNDKKVIWVHASSLGEFEQGRPLIERLKLEFPSIKILLTFFSPSGYEARKNYAHADYIFYLPWDLPKSARRFVQITKPTLAVFIKYEFWHNYISELGNHKIPAISISTILRKEQVYFQWYGNYFANTLRSVDHFFVQNEETAALLDSLSIKQHTITGDTRFDQVKNIREEFQPVSQVESFKDQRKLFIAGSVWKEDMEIITPFISHSDNQWCFIIAPHEISTDFINKIVGDIKEKCIRFSQIKSGDDISSYKAIIIDNIGMLSKLYRYADFAFIGGAFGAGLHNIIEASSNGIPVFFGNKKFKKFREAIDLIKLGAAFPVRNFEEFKLLMNQLGDERQYNLVRTIANNYVAQNTGATEKIMAYCRTKLNQN